MIPVYEPLLKDRKKQLLAECIDSGWISSEGPFVREFEEQHSHYIGAQYGVAVCNGTAALKTALYGIGVRKGDEVIMPSLTIISCALAALRLGARPVLREHDYVVAGLFPCNDQAYKQGFYLPSGLTLTEPQIDVVCEAVRNIIQEDGNGSV